MEFLKVEGPVEKGKQKGNKGDEMILMQILNGLCKIAAQCVIANHVFEDTVIGRRVWVNNVMSWMYHSVTSNSLVRVCDYYGQLMFAMFIY